MHGGQGFIRISDSGQISLSLQLYLKLSYNTTTEKSLVICQHTCAEYDRKNDFFYAGVSSSKVLML